MNDDALDRLVAELLDRHHDRAQLMRNAALTDQERAAVNAVIETADALWLAAHGAPALEDDPVAAMLGLLPDRQCRLDRGALSRARKRARLSVSDVAARLQERGWQFDKSDVFRWETRTADDVAPAVVQAIADIVGTPVDALISTSASSSLPGTVGAVRADPVFDQLVARLAKVRHVSPSVAAATLESRMLATVHRGEQPSPDQLLQSLASLVTAIEQAKR